MNHLFMQPKPQHVMTLQLTIFNINDIKLHQKALTWGGSSGAFFIVSNKSA